jgi:hypothetical protein
MSQFIRKPVIVEARQITRDNIYELAKWCGGYANVIQVDPDIVIRKSKNTERGWIGDWIIKDVEDEFYTCGSTVFEESYDPVETYSYVAAS